jgi:hypothetical protein
MNAIFIHPLHWVEKFVFERFSNEVQAEVGEAMLLVMLL